MRRASRGSTETPTGNRTARAALRIALKFGTTSLHAPPLQGEALLISNSRVPVSRARHIHPLVTHARIPWRALGAHNTRNHSQCSRGILPLLRPRRLRLSAPILV